MIDLLVLLLAVCIVYAVIGNAVVFVLLTRRKVPLRFMWAGTPTYLYRACVDAGSNVGAGLRRFAFSTNVAFVIAMLLALELTGTSR
jgi:hypothetical protein